MGISKNKATQNEIWVNEHIKPETFVRLHSDKPSGPVPGFVDLLIEHGFVPNQTQILDMGCGKGRNSIFLARKGFRVIGTDFVPQAVEEAQRRAKQSGIPAQFDVLDITERWPYHENQFGAILDCNTTICIPNLGRTNAIAEARRVLQQKGYYFFYGICPTEMPKRFSGSEPNSGIFPGIGRFEKQYTKKELLESYKDFEVISIDSISGSDVIDGQITEYSMWVAVFKK